MIRIRDFENDQQECNTHGFQSEQIYGNKKRHRVKEIDIATNQINFHNFSSCFWSAAHVLATAMNI